MGWVLWNFLQGNLILNLIISSFVRINPLPTKLNQLNKCRVKPIQVSGLGVIGVCRPLPKITNLT